MSLNRFSILVIAVIFSLSESQDWCQLIRPKGQYRGLGIYHRFLSSSTHNYIMWSNVWNKQWKFAIRRNGTLPKDWTIKMVPGTNKSMSYSNLVNRFGMSYIYKDVLTADCRIESSKELKVFCKNTINGGNKADSEMTIKFTQNMVLLKPWPKQYLAGEEKAELILVVNKDNRSDYLALNPITKREKHCEVKETACRRPKFIDQMDDNLFKSIEGIVDYNYTQGLSGHLILFTINGRPKYCFTGEEQNISDECKSSENMKSLFENCFLSTPESDSSEVLIVVFSVLIVIFFIAIIVVIVCRSGKKSKKRRIVAEGGVTFKELATHSKLGSDMASAHDSTHSGITPRLKEGHSRGLSKQKSEIKPKEDTEERRSKMWNTGRNSKA